MSLVLGVVFFIFMAGYEDWITACWMFFCVPLVFLVISHTEMSFISETFFGMYFFILTLWCGGLAMVADFLFNLFNRLYFFSLKILMILMFYSFSVSSSAMFYFLFEVGLIPISFMILVGGVRPERVQAVSYMVLYTVMGGAMHMVALIIFYHEGGSMWWFFNDSFSGNNMTLCLSYLLFCAFMVKAPLYGVHFWLPKAHVEAPTSGSMILAAVMLKLGIYGIFRFSYMLSLWETSMLSLQSLGILGGAMASVMAVYAKDFKSVIAYSSVAHMSFCVCGALMYSYVGVVSSFILSCAHGLSSSALFAWAGNSGGVMGSRSTFYVSGARTASSFFMVIFMGCLMFSCGIPPFFSFYSEVLVWGAMYTRMGMLSLLLLFVAGMGVMIAYILMYTKMMTSNYSSHLLAMCCGSIRCEWVVMSHLFPGVIIFFLPGGFSCMI